MSEGSRNGKAAAEKQRTKGHHRKEILPCVGGFHALIIKWAENAETDLLQGMVIVKLVAFGEPQGEEERKKKSEKGTTE